MTTSLIQLMQIRSGQKRYYTKVCTHLVYPIEFAKRLRKMDLALAVTFLLSGTNRLFAYRWWCLMECKLACDRTGFNACVKSLVQRKHAHSARVRWLTISGNKQRKEKKITLPVWQTSRLQTQIFPKRKPKDLDWRLENLSSEKLDKSFKR